MKIIGIGHRARHGKDTFAELFNQRKKIYITYFGEQLKLEVRNIPRKKPLIKWTEKHFHLLQDNEEYDILHDENFPTLVDIMKKRNINVYWGMDGNGYDDKKDGPMLQFWGTNYRRKHYEDDYWVNKVFDNLKANNPDIAIIPDVRFPNELQQIKEHNGWYVRINRYNSDGSLFYDPSRNKDHPSESSLKDFPGDFEMHNTVYYPGDFRDLQFHSDYIIGQLLLN